MESLIPIEIFEKKSLLIRGRKVLLDRDLARLNGNPDFSRVHPSWPNLNLNFKFGPSMMNDEGIAVDGLVSATS
jgi:hypothetical protein